MFPNIICHLAKNPRQLFLIDGIGAGISAILLFAVLVNFNQYFGMPQNALRVLGCIAIAFCVYSSMCYKLVKKQQTRFITMMCLVNLLYCIITAVFVMKYFGSLTALGIGYFLIEITIIAMLAYIEYEVVYERKKHYRIL